MLFVKIIDWLGETITVVIPVHPDQLPFLYFSILSKCSAMSFYYVCVTRNAIWAGFIFKV